MYTHSHINTRLNHHLEIGPVLPPNAKGSTHAKKQDTKKDTLQRRAPTQISCTDMLSVVSSFHGSSFVFLRQLQKIFTFF